ncbi:septum formation initiator [Streptomyces carminius]|uniref:Septum formation initiator n=1 Tax=Streptomyces carminius TaxID=2665496 RepID=A0A2M8LXF7_9ACTN|nr:TadE/TadG family type IV pilus assembly protein [Streptomyces carminius]PJE96631.1 septum formation initiator [Streptomyces carminius]
MSVHRRPYRPGGRRRGRTGADRGQVAVEFVGFLPVLLLIGLAALQLGLVAYAAQQAGTAARAAARAESLEDGPDGAAAGRAAVSDWLTVGFAWGGSSDEVSVTAEVTIPSVVPGIGDFGEVSRTSTMPRD